MFLSCDYRVQIFETPKECIIVNVDRKEGYYSVMSRKQPTIKFCRIQFSLSTNRACKRVILLKLPYYREVRGW